MRLAIPSLICALVGCSGAVHSTVDADVALDAAADAAMSAPDAPPADTSSPDMLAADVLAAEAGCLPQGEKRHMAAMDGYVASLQEFAALTFNSNPPSSGPHCMDPGLYSAYTAQPLPRCNYLENLARGGVVIAYNCTQGCDDLVRDIGRSLIGVTDPDCPALRVVITSDKDLDVRVAAAAWGYTWKSDCFDMAARSSLSKFIGDRLGSKGQAPRRDPVMCK